MKADRLSKSNKIGIVLFQCFVLIMFLFPMSHLVATAHSEEIRVGQIADLTGPSSETGHQSSAGYLDGIEYINNTGGINGRKIKVITIDCAYNIPREIAAYEKLKQKGIVAVLSYSSGGSLHIAKMCAKNKILHQLLGPTDHPQLIGPETPYTFLPYSSYRDEALGAVQYEYDKYPGKKLKAATVTADNPYGYMLRDAVRPICKELGIQLVAEEIVGFKDINATTQMMKIKKRNPDFVIINEIEPATAVILRDAKRAGIDTKKMRFYMLVGSVGQSMLELAGKNAEDTIGMSGVSNWSETNLPAIQRIRKFREEKNERKPVGCWYMMGWAHAELLAEGLRRVGDKKITGKNLKEALETLKNYEMGGICAPITFTSTKHKGSVGIKFFKPDIDKKQWTATSNWIYH